MSRRQQAQVVLMVSALLALTVAGVLWLTSLRASPGLSSAWWAVAVAALVLEARPITLRIRGDRHSITLSEAVLVTGLMTVEPVALVLGLGLGAVPQIVLVQRSRGLKLAFNASLLVASTVLATTLFHLLAAAPAVAGPRTWLAALAGTAAAWLLSAGAVQAVIRVATGSSRHWPDARRAMATTAVVAIGTSTIAVVGLKLFRSAPLDLLLLGPPVAVLVLAAHRQAVEADRAQVLRFSVQAGEALRRDPDPEALILASADSVREATDAAGTLVVLRDGEGVRSAAAGDVDADAATAVVAAWLDTLAPDEQGARIVDAHHHLGPALAASGWTRALVTPLAADGELLGAVLLAERAVRRFTVEDLEPLDTLAATAAATISRARAKRALRTAQTLQADLERRATHDALTGLANRARFDELIAATAGTGWALLYIDLDGFKQVNDTHGHAAGDEILRATASRLTSNLRADDVAFRLGGDEFAVLAHVGDRGDAGHLARRILDALDAPVTVADGVTVPLVASLGVAMPEDHESPHDVTARADGAMYRAKAMPGCTLVWAEAA